MNQRIDFSNLGGFPLDQQALAFMQESYRNAFSGLAGMIGNKVIVSGCEVNGSNVSDGWISYNGELIPFVGGTLGATVIVTEEMVTAVFDGDNPVPVYFTKIATTGVGGVFNFSELHRLQTLINIWSPGDVKEKIVSMSYYNENFDVDGYGLNKEVGWRVLSKAIPDTAGKVFVNIKTSDPDLNEIGKTGGEKTHKLTTSEMPRHRHSFTLQKTRESSGTDNKDIGVEKGNYGSYNFYTDYEGGDLAHNNMPPFFVTLKLIKL